MKEENILDAPELSFTKRKRWLWAFAPILFLTFILSTISYLRIVYFFQIEMSVDYTAQILPEVLFSCIQILSITFSLFFFLNKINPKSIEIIPFLFSSFLITALSFEICRLLFPFVLKIAYWYLSIGEFFTSSWSYDKSWTSYLHALGVYLVMSNLPAVGVFYWLKNKNRWLLPLLILALLIFENYYLYFDYE